MVTSVTLNERDIIDSVHAAHPHRENDDYSFTEQGRLYFQKGLGETGAKYPADTWVGSFRLLGWHLEKLGVSPNPEFDYPDDLDVGSLCLIKGVEHKIYAYADGMVLAAPTDRAKCYNYAPFTLSEIESIKPRN